MSARARPRQRADRRFPAHRASDRSAPRRGQYDEKAGLEAIAEQFELSSRQIRRIVQKELGVPPIQLLLTRRLLLAKQLLTETTLPVTEVAFASGFSSLRRFNDAFISRYRMPPTRLRKKATEGVGAIGESTTLTLQLSYRPPYDWKGVLAFLRTRALEGVEWVTDEAYARTVALGDVRGWIRVTQSPKKHALMLEFTHGLTPALPAVLSRVRALFDLDARPDLIARHLAGTSGSRGRCGPIQEGACPEPSTDSRWACGRSSASRSRSRRRGRSPVASSRHLASRWSTPFAELNRLTPLPARIAAASVDEVARLGIIAARARSIIAPGQAQRNGALSP